MDLKLTHTQGSWRERGTTFKLAPDALTEKIYIRLLGPKLRIKMSFETVGCLFRHDYDCVSFQKNLRSSIIFPETAAVIPSVGAGRDSRQGIQGHRPGGCFGSDVYCTVRPVAILLLPTPSGSAYCLCWD